MVLDISCEVQEGKITTIYGPSGAGKTTILRILAGLLQPEKGYINAGGEIWLDTAKKINLPPQKRSIGFVFQDFALFPNMTVRGNLEYALGKGQQQKIIDDLTEVMELEQLQHRYPETLSGGQKQRAALARALVRMPKLLLLDEPLSSLDNNMRLKLQDHILKIHQSYNLTIILVSHDVAEIYKMSDEIFVLNEGIIVKHGTTGEIFSPNFAETGFHVIGEILDMEWEGIVYTVSVIAFNTVINITASEMDIQHLKPGDKVIVFSKDFNPTIKKIEN